MENIVLSIIAIVISIISIVLSFLANKRQNQLAVFSEYTKRYQDIMMHIYSCRENKEVYHRLYFDLCSEEYYLRKQKLVSEDIWEYWIYGMKMTVRDTCVQGAWVRDEVYYDKYPEFQKFFKKIIEDSKDNKY